MMLNVLSQTQAARPAAFVRLLHCSVGLVCASVWFCLVSCASNALAQTPSKSPSARVPGADAPQLDVQTRVAELIEQLGDDNYRRRRNAQDELQQIGLPAFEQLRVAASRTNSNPEVSRTANYLLDSQQVTWTLDTDSILVRDALRYYNTQSLSGKQTQHQFLANLGTSDALLALARLTRFESDEQLSESAALALMFRVAQDRSQAEFLVESEKLRAQQASFRDSLRETINGSSRTACRWLIQLALDLEAAQPLMPETDEASQAKADQRNNAWRSATADALNVAREADDDQATESALRLHRWLGQWIAMTDGHERAVDIVRGCLPLVGNELPELRKTAAWLLDGSLPELLIDLNEQNAELFSESPSLAFLLAEAHLRLDNAVEAQRIADRTSRGFRAFLTDRIAGIRQAADMDELESARRNQLALDLELRGMVSWAEREYLLAITLEVERRARLAKTGTLRFSGPTAVEVAMRKRLAMLYWEGGENAKAAEALRPVAEFLESSGSELPRGTYYSPHELTADYHFYSGLAAADKGENQLAAERLLQAARVKRATANPDILIALRSVASDGSSHEDYEKEFDAMAAKFRERVNAAESSLVLLQDRDSQQSVKREIALACNELAWLLANCDQQPSEAIHLSKRSLELYPRTATYLDTLGRCYFANGQIEEAIRTQRQAVALEPHQRQLSVQLESFLQAASPATSK